MLQKKLLVLVPCHNEEKSIGATIRAIKLHAQNSDIVVINNASTDNTGVEALKEGVTVIFEPRLGKGFAVRKGFQRLRDEHEFVLMIDGDNTYGFNCLKEAAEKLSNGYDMAIGRRVKKDQGNLTSSGEQFRLGHEVGNYLFSRMFSLFLE